MTTVLPPLRLVFADNCQDTDMSVYTLAGCKILKNVTRNVDFYVVCSSLLDDSKKCNAAIKLDIPFITRKELDKKYMPSQIQSLKNPPNTPINTPKPAKPTKSSKPAKSSKSSKSSKKVTFNLSPPRPRPIATLDSDNLALLAKKTTMFKSPFKGPKATKWITSSVATHSKIPLKFTLVPMSPSKKPILDTSTYTTERLLTDIQSDEFVQNAMNCEVDLLKFKTKVYTDLNKIKMSSETSQNQPKMGFDTDLNAIMTEMLKVIEYKKDILSTKNIEDKRIELDDIVNNPLYGIDTIKGLARAGVKTQIIKFVYMFFKAPTIFAKAFTNFMLTGAAGSGKTKIAMCIAHVLSKLGLLVTSTVQTATRQSLVGEFIGQSAPKTRSVLSKALEGVLFIDEAYTLTPCPSDSAKSNFESESVGELINFMDKFIGCLVVIVAGYKKEMTQCFLPFNEGLARRFPRVIDLPDYLSEDLWSLFINFIQPNGIDLPKEIQAYMYSIIVALNERQVFKNQAGDMLNLAMMVTEDVLLCDGPYGHDQVNATIRLFCSQKFLDFRV